MTSHKKVAFLVLLASLTVSSVGPMQAQQRRITPTTPSTPSYTPPPAPRAAAPPPQTQSQPAPQRNFDPPPRQSSPAPPRQTAPAQQHQAPSYAEPPTSNRSQSFPRTQNSPEPPRSQQTTPAPREQRQVQQKQQQQQQKEEARQQKENTQQAQKVQKDQAHRQKQEAKQQQKLQKEQARQEKERMKNEQRAQKQQARGQKTYAAEPGKEDVAPKPATESAPTTLQPRLASASAYHIPGGNSVSGRTSAGSMTLTREGSQSVVQQVNSARSRMSGINQRPLPPGDVTVHSNGRLTLNAAAGRHYGVRSDGTIASYRDSTKTVSFDRRGRVSSLRTSNLEVRRGAHGERTIISRRADNSRLVSTGPHSGYIERNVVSGNRSFIQRTAVINQIIITRNYVAYNYAGVRLMRFVTPGFYAPAFYGWAFYPWAAPVRFTFGWMGAPWYVGPYPYFTAYPVYPGAAFWLTDYLLGETLATAYQLHADEVLADEAYVDDNVDSADAAAPDSDDSEQFDTLRAEATTPISPELKAAINEEVKQELSYDSAASAAQNEETGYDEVSSLLGSPNRVFVVSDDLDVTTVDEQGCGLQPGDILQLEAAPASDSALVQLRVASSKKMDCPAGVMVTVSVSDLQEMHNNFRAQVEAGLGALQAGQGHNGIPVAPPTVAAPPRPTLVGETSASSADINAMFDTQRQQADQAEAQALGPAF